MPSGFLFGDSQNKDCYNKNTLTSVKIYFTLLRTIKKAAQKSGKQRGYILSLIPIKIIAKRSPFGKR